MGHEDSVIIHNLVPLIQQVEENRVPFTIRWIMNARGQIINSPFLLNALKKIHPIHSPFIGPWSVQPVQRNGLKKKLSSISKRCENPRFMDQLGP